MWLPSILLLSQRDIFPLLQGLRSHPLGPEVELSSFSGNSSVAVASSPRSSEVSPRLTPLPEQLESADSASSEQALNQWNEAPPGARKAKRVREYEMAVMDHPDTTQHSPDNMPAAALLDPGESDLPTNEQHPTDPLTAQTTFYAPDGSPNTDDSEPLSSLTHKLPSQEAALDDAFPSIRKITPVGSPDDDADVPLQTSHSHQDQVRHLLRVLQPFSSSNQACYCYSPQCISAETHVKSTLQNLRMSPSHQHPADSFVATCAATLLIRPCHTARVRVNPAWTDPHCITSFS